MSAPSPEFKVGELQNWKIDMREIHLWDFPESKISVCLSEEFRKQFFKELCDKEGDWIRLARKVGLCNTAMWTIMHGKKFRYETNKSEKACIKLVHLKNFCRAYAEKFGMEEKAVMETIEKNLVHYSGYSGAKGKVFNPILPIKIRPEIFRIIGHMICDGSWVPRCSPKYINTSPELRTAFISDLKKSFGDVEAKEVFYDERAPIVTFPIAVVHILNHIFDTKFAGIVGSPKFLERLSKEEKAYFIQAVFDDEGCALDSNLYTCSTDEKLLLKVKDMLKEDFDIDTSALRMPIKDYIKVDGSRSKVFYLSVYSRSTYNFSKYIGFQHERKKTIMNRMLAVHKRERIPTADEMKNMIVSELKKNGPMTAMDLSIIIVMTAKNVRKHLRRLESNGILETAGKKKSKDNGMLWRLKDSNL